MILAIDQGTTSSKVLVMDDHLAVLASHSTPFQQHFPSPGLVEHDLDQIWDSVLTSIAEVGKVCDLKKVRAIGITNQRETVGFWDPKTLKPFGRALVWQDRRTSARCDDLRTIPGQELQIAKKTGLLLDPYFSSTKIEWSLKKNSVIQAAQKQQQLAIGTMDTFLLAKLTKSQEFFTEPSNASRTMLFDIHRLKWDSTLLHTFSVQESDLPFVKDSFGSFGFTKDVPGLPNDIPITGMLGDQQSALLGQAAVDVGQAKCTFGTGSFMLLNLGSDPTPSQHRLLTTIAWVNQGRPTYALEGSAFMAGATIQWLRDGLKMIQNSSEIEALARSVDSSEGVVFVPAFTGLGAPHWNPEARAAIFGMTRGTTRAHIARAALEGIALQNTDILRAMEKDIGRPLVELRVDGGACKDNLLMQIQADFLDRPLLRPKQIETTSLGAIFAAGLGAGIWSSMEQIKQVWKLDREFKSEIAVDTRNTILSNWERALQHLD